MNIQKKDIQRAINLFRAWDLEKKWKIPSQAFIAHIEKKSYDSLSTAEALHNLMINEKLKGIALPGRNFDASLWIINAAYYSMFFLAQLLLARDSKKMPEGTEDTHRTTWLAMLYYFIIKGSGTEGKKNISWDDIKHSRLSDALILFKQSQTEVETYLQKAKRAIEDFKLEQDKRSELTYSSTEEMELSTAETSIERAKKFRTIVLEYLQAKNR